MERKLFTNKFFCMCLPAFLIIFLLMASQQSVLAATQKKLKEASQTNVQPVSAKISVISPNSSNGISQGGFLVVTGTQENTFAVAASDNEIIFPMTKGTQKAVKAQSVTSDGRVMGVVVPIQSQSGEVTIKKGGQEIGKISIAISEASLWDKYLNVALAVLPLLLFVVILFFIRCALKGDNWLKKALSESEALRQNNGDLLMDSDNSPVYPRSASRMIAFVGLFGIIVWIMGIMGPSIYRFSLYGEFPDLDGISKFLLAQAGIFTPYIANKIAAALK